MFTDVFNDDRLGEVGNFGVMSTEFRVSDFRA
jgi:hypothetical protein